jgi:hypothetical protein
MKRTDAWLFNSWGNAHVVSSQVCRTHERRKISRAVHSKGTCILDDVPSRERRLACSAAEIDSACATTRPRASLFACHELSTQAPPYLYTNLHVMVILVSCYTLLQHAASSKTYGHFNSNWVTRAAPDIKKGSKKSTPASRQPYPCKEQKPAAA